MVQYEKGKWIVVSQEEFQEAKTEGFKVKIVFLQVAHLDHDPSNNDLSNLLTFCPTCHHVYDQRHKQLMRIASLCAASKGGI